MKIPNRTNRPSFFKGAGWK